MGTVVDTQALDLRAQGGLDGGKSRGGQGENADAFAAVLSDIGDTKPTVPTDAATTAPTAPAPVVPPDPSLLNLSAGTFALTSAPSMPASASLKVPAPNTLAATTASPAADTSTSISQAESVEIASTPSTASLFQALIDGTRTKASAKGKTGPHDDDVMTAAAPTAPAADRSTSISQAASVEVASTPSTTSLFQALIDGTGTKASAKAKTGPRDDDVMTAAAPTADSQGALTLPALIAAAAASQPPVLAQGTSESKAAPSIKAAPVVASPTVASPVSTTTDDATLSADTAVPISDVKVETHIAVAASHAVSKDQAEPQAAPAEATDPTLPTGALAAMAPQTRSVVQAVETLLDQAPVAAPPDPVSIVAPAPPRTMTLQLTPPDLGTVQVRLHLNGQALDLQLSVSSKETLGVISRDRGHLETALASQNYDLRTLTIQGADGAGAATTGDPKAGGRGASEQGGAQNQSPSTSGNSDGGGGNERRRADSRGIASDEDARAAAAPRAGALFV